VAPRHVAAIFEFGGRKSTTELELLFDFCGYYHRVMARTPQDSDDQPDIDPAEFLRALLRVSPEDAEKARDDSPAPAGQEGRVHDYGDD